MGPFLATRVPIGAGWLLGVAAAAITVAVATFPEPDGPTAMPRARLWEHHGCAKLTLADQPQTRRLDAPRVFVGPMNDGGTHRALLQETTRATIASHRPSWRVEVTDKPSTEVPGFYLEGTVEDLDTTSARARSTIECRVTFWLASAGGSRFAITSGAARVLTTRDRTAVELSREACVQSVVEDLIETKLIQAIEHPTLEDLSPTYRE